LTEKSFPILSYAQKKHRLKQVYACTAWFPALRYRSSVTVSPWSVSKIRKNYVYPQEVLKNSVACAKKLRSSFLFK